MNQSDRETRKSSFEKGGSDLPPKLFPCNPGPNMEKQQASDDGGGKRGVIVAPTPEAGRD